MEVEGREGKGKILVPMAVSVLSAIAITYLTLQYLPLIVKGVLLLMALALIFTLSMAATWMIVQLVFLPYYALTKVKPREEESRGGYRLEDVEPAESEEITGTIPPRRPTCPRCGVEIRWDANFCPKCGAPITPPKREETRYRPERMEGRSSEARTIPFFTKLFRAATLDSEFYEEIEHDPTAFRDAALTIILVNLCSGIGLGVRDLIYSGGTLSNLPSFGFNVGVHVIFALIRWIVLAGSIYVVGVKFIGGTADFMEVARTIAFAYAPVSLQILTPLTGGIIVIGTNLWLFAALIVAVRQSLDISTGRAFGVIILSGILYLILSGLLGAYR